MLLISKEVRIQNEIQNEIPNEMTMDQNYELNKLWSYSEHQILDSGRTGLKYYYEENNTVKFFEEENF